jgi:hypothetical protein
LVFEDSYFDQLSEDYRSIEANLTEKVL